MKKLALYADSADTDAIATLLADGLIRGVTTNPTILRASGHSADDIPDLYQQWARLGAQEVCFQATGATSPELAESAARIADLGPGVVVKLPATRIGLATATSLIGNGTSVLLTAVYTVAQAAIVGSLGARYIAPYLGRLEDSGRDGVDEIARMTRALDGSPTDTLAASVRSANALAQLVLAGVRHITAAPTVLVNACTSADSDAAAAVFDADARG